MPFIPYLRLLRLCPISAVGLSWGFILCILFFGTFRFRRFGGRWIVIGTFSILSCWRIVQSFSMCSAGSGYCRKSSPGIVYGWGQTWWHDEFSAIVSCKWNLHSCSRPILIKGVWMSRRPVGEWIFRGACIFSGSLCWQVTSQGDSKQFYPPSLPDYLCNIPFLFINQSTWESSHWNRPRTADCWVNILAHTSESSLLIPIHLFYATLTFPDLMAPSPTDLSFQEPRC